MSHTFLFIDGSNLYASQYELFGPQKYIDFNIFIHEIEFILETKFDAIFFYASYSPQPNNLNHKEKQYLKNEALFYKSVKAYPKISFFTGYRSKSSGKEKEVDVKIAVDIVDFAHRKLMKQIVLLTGDADFMEALHVAKKQGIRVSVLCMENKIMYKALIFYSVTIILLTSRKVLIHKIRRKPNIIKIDSTKILRKI